MNSQKNLIFSTDKELLEGGKSSTWYDNIKSHIQISDHIAETLKVIGSATYNFPELCTIQDVQSKTMGLQQEITSRK